MRFPYRLILVSICIILLIPALAHAKAFEKWLIRSEKDIDAWWYTNLQEGTLTPDGLEVDVEGEAVMYRPLPEGFRPHVDAIVIHLYQSTLDEVSILLVDTDGKSEGVMRTVTIDVPLSDTEYTSEYISLYPYRYKTAGTDQFVLRFRGDAENVVVDGVRFISHSFLEKLVGSFRSFFTIEPIMPHSINLIVGPSVVPDIGMFGELDMQIFTFYTSFNAYLLVWLSLAAIGVLFWALWYIRKHHVSWGWMRRRMLVSIFIIITIGWVGYDMRMSAEMIINFSNDLKTYVLAGSDVRNFRDRERAYDFAKFVAPLVADRDVYELFLHHRWPYTGLIRYYTYPSLPNVKVQISDTWVVYDRPDIVYGEDRRLSVDGEVLSRPGILLGVFEEGSYVFREDPFQTTP